MTMVDAMKQSRNRCGQMTYLLSHAFIIVYLSWALLPTLLSSTSSAAADLVIEQRDDKHQHHSPIWISNFWAAYIPTYLALLFLFVPPLYMGLNMKSVPPEDDIDWIWDTRSNTNNSNCSRQDYDSLTTLTAATTSTAGNRTNDDGNGLTIEYSLPEICDVDVRMINSRVHRILTKANENNIISSAEAEMETQ